jgi:hypothetical protein
VDKSNPGNIKSFKRAFGYADNTPKGIEPYTIPDNPYTEIIENAGGDAFDISWAVDVDDNYIYLDTIHFIKVQNAMQDNAGWLGEFSTEIIGACKVVPNTQLNGENRIALFETLPDTISTEEFELIPYTFINGKRHNLDYQWETSHASAFIDENNILHVSENGNLEISVFLNDEHNVRFTQNCVINLSNSIPNNLTNNIGLYPSPATDYTYISGIQNAKVQIISPDGKVLLTVENYHSTNRINLTNCPSGILIIRVINQNFSKSIPLIKI